MYDKKMIKIGRISIGLAIIANFIPAIYVGLRFGEMPMLSVIFQIWGLVAATYGISWLVQPIAYYPTLGAPGSYIGWLAGSVGDIRMPAASMAQKIAGVEAGTHEGEVVGTIGTCCSIFVSASMITLFTIVGYKVIPLLPEFVTNSFNYILPALFGAIYVDIARKDIRAGGCTIAAALAIMYFGEKVGIPGGLLTLFIVLGGILITRVFFVIDTNKTKE
ncbi:membrane protein [Clostridioides difficile]|nr:membrane protein [Clostridioides difficile]